MKNNMDSHFLRKAKLFTYNRLLGINNENAGLNSLNDLLA